MGIEFWTALGALAAFATVVVMGFQNRSANRQLEASLRRSLKQLEVVRYSADWRAKEKGIELALFYQEQILPRIAYTECVLRQIDVFKEMQRKLRRENLERFDAVEYAELMGMKPEVAYTAVRELTLTQLLHAHYRLMGDCPSMTFPLKDPGNVENLSDEEKENLRSVLVAEFDSITNELLNKLEYFCMYINSNLVDGDVIYPSIHQTFFSVVRSLYYQICLVNKGSSSDRYYTHIRDTYLSWSERYSKNRASESEAAIMVNRPYKQVERP